MKDYLLKMPQELHTRLKVITAIKGITMAQFIVDAVTEKLNREEK